MATLCDRATVREGLLHILGAGVTQTSLALPNAADLDVALLIQADDRSEVSGRHTLSVVLKHEDGQRIGAAELIWEAPVVEQPEDAPHGSLPILQLPIVVPLRGMILQNDGLHHVDVSVDGQPLAEVSFTVTKAELPGVTMQLR